MQESHLKKIIELSQHPAPLSPNKAEYNEFYKAALTKIASRKIFTWNWAAFFFAYFWMLYRKMYLSSFLFLMVDLFGLVEGITRIYGPDVPSLPTLIVLIPWAVRFIVIPSLSNFLYYKHLSWRVYKGYSLVHEPPILSLWRVVFFPAGYLRGFSSWRASRKKIKQIHAENP